MPPNRLWHILVIEDNPTDVLLIREALTQHGVMYDLTVLDDGDKALNYLRDLRDAEPDLIILDLNLPRRNGVDVLLEYRMNVALYAVPIIVLTSSNSPSDRLRTITIGVSAFIQKPMMLDDFVALGARFKAILEQPFIYVGPREEKAP